MAIYKNREVTVVGPNPQLNNPDSITIEYKDGTHENVKLADVSFTKAEKDSLVKLYPSRYDNVNVITDEDVKAVRVGVAPPSDQAVAERAHFEALRKKQIEAGQKANDEAAKKAEADVNKDLNKPNPTAPGTGGTTPQNPVAKPSQV